VYGTPYTNSVRIWFTSVRRACRAVLEEASCDIADVCLPSRLSRVRAPSPALLPKPLFSKCFTGRFRRSEQWWPMRRTVFFLSKRRSTNTCLHFWQTPASRFTSWQKCSQTHIGRLFVTGTAYKATIDHALRKNKGGRCSLEGDDKNPCVVVSFILTSSLLVKR